MSSVSVVSYCSFLSEKTFIIQYIVKWSDILRQYTYT